MYTKAVGAAVTRYTGRNLARRSVGLLPGERRDACYRLHGRQHPMLPARFLFRTLRRFGSVESPELARRPFGCQQRSTQMSTDFAGLGASRPVVDALRE